MVGRPQSEALEHEFIAGEVKASTRELDKFLAHFRECCAARRSRLREHESRPQECAQEMAWDNLLAIYLIAVGILTLTGLGIGIITGVLALLAGIFILIGR